NAKVFEQEGAAVLRQETELDSGALVTELTRIFDEDGVLEAMSEKADSLAVKDAAGRICDVISVDVLT
ncbi:MAG: UDP-N-acetylglucosamine--N-acetylmuramyl-(pentapeptide) pyrophosphoryl-undecaprenol N-acetylglucosamine transferase, partial [Akkermansiaceae bacterium]